MYLMLLLTSWLSLAGGMRRPLRPPHRAADSERRRPDLQPPPSANRWSYSTTGRSNSAS